LPPIVAAPGSDGRGLGYRRQTAAEASRAAPRTGGERGPPTSAGRSEPPGLSAVIVTYNSVHLIGECLEAIRARLGAVEVLVVDNQSEDDTVATATAADWQARIISMGRNAGYGSACNRGVRESANEHVLLMNPDVVIEHADVAALKATLSQSPLGLVAPAMRNQAEKVGRPQAFPRSPWLEELSILALGPFRPRALSRRARPVDTDAAAWAAGALLLIRRSEFLEVGGFDERFFLYYEDQDLGIRYHDAGLPIRSTSALSAAHDGGQSDAHDTDQRIAPMAWCILSWLELVSRQYGTQRAKLSWRLIRACHRTGARLVGMAAMSGLPRFRRKAEQLTAVGALVEQLARDGVVENHESCPSACKVVYEA
jgi:GT2 family glycosyltransferase